MLDGLVDTDYYRAYASLERAHWWFRVRNDILAGVAKRLVGSGSARIANVGCGTGKTSELLADLGDVTSVEYDSQCAKVARELTGMEIQVGDVLDLDLTSCSFDLVTAFDVIEHVEDDRRAVTELYRVCAPGGFVCLTVPALPWLWSEHDDINHHFRRYTANSLLAACRGAVGDDIEVVQFGYFNFLLLPLVGGFRLVSRFKDYLGLSSGTGTGASSDFEAGGSGLGSKLLGWAFGLERSRLVKGAGFPLGVSLLIVLRKPNSKLE